MKFVAPALVCLALLAGCAPKSPLQQPVAASSAEEFSVWQGDIDRNLPAEEAKWAVTALQEFKLQTMMAGKVTGTDAVATAVRERVNGRSLGDVMNEGLNAYLKRKTAEREEMEAAYKLNGSRRVTDPAMQKELTAHQENLKAKIDKAAGEITAVQAELTRISAALKQ